MRQLPVTGAMQNAVMKQILMGALGTLALAVVLAAGVFHAGLIDVAADTPHAPAVHRLIEWVRDRSIARRSADIVPPGDLADAARVRRGAGNYDAMCVGCHLAPGIADTEIRKGLYPVPPELADPAGFIDSARMDARRFWIIKHGIKASAMPAWGQGGMEDAAIWDLTAFLQVLPRLSPQEYRQEVAASEGHAHGGLPPPPAAAHDHGSHPH
jgi:mono/diheme cytochrome c family protein